MNNHLLLLVMDNELSIVITTINHNNNDNNDNNDNNNDSKNDTLTHKNRLFY